VTLFDSQSYEALGASLDQMRAAGVNTLFFRVFQNRGDRSHGFVRSRTGAGVYFATDHAPVVADVLGRVCAMAHARGLRVFAWMTTRQCGWLLEERPDLAGWRFDPARGAVVRTAGLNLFHPEVTAYLRRLFADLARHPIDGVLFQDDLVLRHTEGLGPEADRQYRRRFGRGLTPERLFDRQDGRLVYSSEFWRWAVWKNEQILRVVDAVIESAAARHAGLYWALNGYYESVTEPRQGLAWYAQDLQRALSGRVDYLCIMAYHRQIMEELALPYGEALAYLTGMTREAIRMAEHPHRIIMKVQSLDWHTESPLPAAELSQVFQAVRAGGETGLVYVRGKNPPPLAPVRRVYSR
jgi:biofilm PGA synthesis lipoprotein PgaB